MRAAVAGAMEFDQTAFEAASRRSTDSSAAAASAASVGQRTDRVRPRPLHARRKRRWHRGGEFP